VAGLAAAFGSGAMTNSINEFLSTDCFFVIGSNTTENHPIIAGKILEAKNRGAKIVVADPRRIHIAHLADLHLRQRLGTDIALVNGMMNYIVEHDLHDKAFVEERTEGFEEMLDVIKEYPLDKVAEITGVPKDDIAKAAEMYAESERSAIIYAMGITQHHVGTDNVKSLANLAMLCGKMGKESCGVNPLRGQNNVQGACDLGGLPNVFTGYQKVTDPDAVKKFEQAWGVEGLNDKVGLTIPKMMDAAHEGKLKALFVHAENPMLSDPNIAHVEEALKKLELLVVLDIFMTETAELAHVVLPGSTFAERDGTYTNSERRVQRIRKAVEPVGDAKEDWLILKELMERAGMPPQPASPEEVFEELRKVTPQYAGMTYERIDEVGLQWPCPTEDHPGTPYLHKDKFARGKGQFFAIHHREPAEVPDEEYPLWLTTGRTYFHFHTTSMTRRAELLLWEVPTAYVEISREDADRFEIQDGEVVRLTTRRGSVELQAIVTDRVGPGLLFVPFHFAEAAANRLTNDALDPVANIPELKVCAVRLERVA